MIDDLTRLDSDELLHLALDASQKEQPAKAIEYLKRAAEISPDNADVRYMLGAEHAQIGMYERAMEDMAAALQINPELDTARFQLGLLYLTSKRVVEAIDVWQPLDRLGEDNSLYLFKTGLIHLAQDEFNPCLEYLRRGIANNSFNLALNNDMQRIIDEVTPLAAAQDSDAPPPRGEEPTGHLFLNAYTGQQN